MDQALNDRILTLVQNSKANDYDQRSALGIARSWLGQVTPEPLVRGSAVMGRRDDLAEALIEAIKESPRTDAIAALRATRTFINAPFLDPGSNGQQHKPYLRKGGADDQSEATR